MKLTTTQSRVLDAIRHDGEAIAPLATDYNLRRTWEALEQRGLITLELLPEGSTRAIPVKIEADATETEAPEPDPEEVPFWYGAGMLTEPMPSEDQAVSGLKSIPDAPEPEKGTDGEADSEAGIPALGGAVELPELKKAEVIALEKIMNAEAQDQDNLVGTIVPLPFHAPSILDRLQAMGLVGVEVEGDSVWLTQIGYDAYQAYELERTRLELEQDAKVKRLPRKFVMDIESKGYADSGFRCDNRKEALARAKGIRDEGGYGICVTISTRFHRPEWGVWVKPGVKHNQPRTRAEAVMYRLVRTPQLLDAFRDALTEHLHASYARYEADVAAAERAIDVALETGRVDFGAILLEEHGRIAA